LQENSTVSGFLDSFQIEEYMMEMGLPEAFANALTEPMMRLFSILSSSGIQIFIFLAALKTIPPSLYESSHMEGATGWETFWKITFPMVSPMILVNVVYTVIDSFLSSSNTALRYVQRTIFTNMKFGYGSALAWIYFAIISVILALVVLLISRRVFYYDK
jgi:ABC-type sugar transport system permease subunit